MIKLYCFSGSGRSFEVADYFSRELEVSIEEIKYNMDFSHKNHISVVVFPVYCQNIPLVVKDFLKRLKTEKILLIATYGKISYGNVLYEASKIINSEIIGASYVPIGHTFLDETNDFDLTRLSPIIEKIKNPQGSVIIPKSFKNPLANLFPNLRSRMATKIKKDESLCEGCNLCGEKCSENAIEKGKIKGDCIRCLKCVSVCPKHALKFYSGLILKLYLSQERKNEFKLFL